MPDSLTLLIDHQIVLIPWRKHLQLLCNHLALQTLNEGLHSVAQIPAAVCLDTHIWDASQLANVWQQIRCPAARAASSRVQCHLALAVGWRDRLPYGRIIEARHKEESLHCLHKKWAWILLHASNFMTDVLKSSSEHEPCTRREGPAQPANLLNWGTWPRLYRLSSEGSDTHLSVSFLHCVTHLEWFASA